MGKIKSMKSIKMLLGTLTFTLGLAVSGSGQTLLTNGLVAYYPFDGNANDASGNGNNGIPQNVSFTSDRFGMPSSAAHFSGQLGTNSAINCPTLNSLQYLPITYSCWFRLDGYTVAPGEVMTLVGREQSDIPNIEGALALVTTQGPGFTNELTYTTPQLFHFNSFHPTTNRWYQSVLTIDTNALISLFINGSLFGVAQSSMSALAGAVPLPFRIGDSTYDVQINPNGDAGAPRYSWVGSIDDVRIYDRALSTNEIQQLYQFEAGPNIALIKAVKPSFSNLSLGTNYQLQVSGDLNSWTNQGSVFAATNSAIVYPQYFDVENFGELFFRVQVAP
jgi:hypothetical protein